MGENIKSRLAALGRSQRDLVKELNKMGEIVSVSQLSLYISGADFSPKAFRTLKRSEKIISEWEKENAENKGNSGGEKKS